MRKILVTGANGQLGSEIRALAPRLENYQFVFTDALELDLTDKNALNRIFEQNAFFACINAAAYTQVEQAQNQEQEAQALNITAVGNLAYLCDNYDTHFFHISTDYVFDGKKNFPYTEEDDTNALSVYGQTKAIGETLALQHSCTFVLRTSWLYSSYGKNFVKTMLRLAQEQKPIKVVDDQIGTPTYAADLAQLIFRIMETPNFEKYSGLYHYSNEGVASWYDFAKSIFEIQANPVQVVPIRSAQFPTLAPRPAYSVLDKSKIKATFGIQIPDWRDSLKECLTKI